MATKIRLARAGAKKRPFYRIVVANSRSPRDGDFIEKLGTYNPLASKDKADRVTLNAQKVEYWLSKGAQPTEVVIKFIQQQGIKLPEHIQKQVDVKLKSRKPKAPKKEAAGA